VTGNERGYTLVEMLVVMSILSVVMAGLTTVFVGGSHAELDLNRRFQAQQQARLAVDKIKLDLHCASAAEVDVTSGSPTLGMLKIAEDNCSSTHVTYCAVTSPNMSTRYALYRTTNVTSTRCSSSSDTSRKLVADYLTKNTGLWSFSAPDGLLEMISIDFPISVNPTATRDVYELKDILVARNSVRCSTTCTQSAYPVSP
jgi:prepilin-type N-terminal cleavage/methylation domain-containing protein